MPRAAQDPAPSPLLHRASVSARPRATCAASGTPAGTPSRGIFLLSGLAVAILVPLAGCAQQQSPGYYDLPPASTVTDAQYMGTGAGYRPVVRAPAQLQIDLKAPSPTDQQKAAQERVRAQQAGRVAEDGEPVPVATADSGAQARASGSSASPNAAPASVTATNPANSKLVPKAQTYIGTLPCFAAGMNCEAQRITLTLAPNGRWRGRSAYLDNAKRSEQPIAEQGCWDATDEKPPRVFLTGADGNARAEFILAANNVLRLRSANGVTPNLNYTLTRQPDLDPIDELAKQSPPKCP